MATFSKLKLSGSTNGKAISIAATATPGTTIHTAVSGANDYDEIWIYVMNNNGSSVTVTFEWGGTAADDLLVISVPSKSGLELVVPGLLLQNSLVLSAFASVADDVSVLGFVNRIAA